MNMQNSGNENLIIKCDDIQSLLLDYATRELGHSRSALVREHLRQCEKCRESFKEIMSTVEILQNASTPDDQLPGKLSEKHHARIIRALAHPMLNWIFEHHILVSAIIALVAMILTLFTLRTVRILKNERLENLDKRYEIYLQDVPAVETNQTTPVIHWYKENHE